MAIDLITGHQGVSHISADQIATINNAMMDNFGANKVMRLVGGELTADGLTITISEGYWRVNGFDMEIQEGETLYIDPTTIGLSRIDDIYVEILQDIPTGAQRAEIYIALGEPSATPTAPDEPTAPYLNTDILLQIIKLARVTVSEGAMIMEDYSLAYNIVTPEDLAEVQTEVDTIVNVYGAKNLLPIDYPSSTKNGITFTVNDDGSVTANGTATANAAFLIVKSNSPSASWKSLKNIISGKTIILNGCPSGGSGRTYALRKWGQSTSGTYTDYGNGVEFTPTESSLTDYNWDIEIVIYSGQTANNLTFKPMIRLASIQDDTYVPYAKTNKELTDAFTNQVANSDDTYSPSKAYKVGEHCIYNNVIYKCITACSAAAWSVNQNCFEPTTLTTAVTELNSDLTWKYLGKTTNKTDSVSLTNIDYQELYVDLKLEGMGRYYPILLIKGDTGIHQTGSYTDQGYHVAVAINYMSNSVKVHEVYSTNSESLSSGFTMSVYYR